MSTVREHIEMLIERREQLRRKGEDGHGNLQNDFLFKMQSVLLTSVHLDELIALATTPPVDPAPTPPQGVVQAAQALLDSLSVEFGQRAIAVHHSHIEALRREVAASQAVEVRAADTGGVHSGIALRKPVHGAVPMTDRQIHQAWESSAVYNLDQFTGGIRAAEAHHGIKA